MEIGAGKTAIFRISLVGMATSLKNRQNLNEVNTHIHTRQEEINSVEQWARTNNLKVNPSKYAEIVFCDNRRKTKVKPPPALLEINQNHQNPRSHLHQQLVSGGARAQCDHLVCPAVSYTHLTLPTIYSV